MLSFSAGHFVRDKWRGKKQELSKRVTDLEMEVQNISKDVFFTIFSVPEF